ncbi:MAG: glycerate kinase [Clostridia bacterium]|nr:glycerate kinase [Clostridia bacterium]
MKVTVAIDSFKGSLSTFEAGSAAKDGIKKVFPEAEVVISPLADGGEGTVDAVVSANNGEYITATVTGPLGEKVDAKYGIIPERKLAVMEMSAAAGITLVPEEKRTPLDTTTYGVGEMIKDALSKGMRKFVIGIGGSATNDGGVGMLQALGFRFTDDSGKDVPFGAKGLEKICNISDAEKDSRLSECEFYIACDVKNPLCGDNGCSRIYGPQKGATEEMIKDMDLWLSRYALLTKNINREADSDYPGSGAAGGMGFAFMAYLGGELKSGIELVMAETGIEEHIKDSDFVITGEGRLDGQSYMGKAPIGIAKLSKKYGKTVIAFSGAVTDDAAVCNEHGIDAFFPIVKAPCSLLDAMNKENAYKNLKATAVQIFNLIKVIKKAT